MGRTYTPAYAIEIDVPGFIYTPAGWTAREFGRPTDANLKLYVERFEASTQPGGANAHLGPTKVRAARIYTNRGERKLVASYPAQPLKLAGRMIGSANPERL
jgi:hypothetical protein